MANLSEGLKEPVEENTNIQQKDFNLTLEEVSNNRIQRG